MMGTHRVLLVAALAAVVGGCDDGRDPPPPFEHGDLYGWVASAAESFTFVEGDWTEDFGDAAAYGLAFYARAGTATGDAAYLARAAAAYERNWALMQDVNLLSDDANEVMMSALGLIEYIDATGDRASLPDLDAVIDECDWTVDLLQGYLEPSFMPGYSMETYGPTSINGLVGLINLQHAHIIGDERKADYVAFAEALAARIEERSWNGATYDFGEDRPGLFLYPNITMILYNGRLYQLTGKAAYLDRALATWRGIQPLRVDEESGLAGPGRFRSPYSAASMGATTDDYTTLSSQNYLMFALIVLYEATGDATYLEHMDPVLDFAEHQLEGTWCLTDVDEYYPVEACTPACAEGSMCVAGVCTADRCQDGVLHHWMDGRLAIGTDPEFFCSGCNLQLLYLMWYRQYLL